MLESTVVFVPPNTPAELNLNDSQLSEEIEEQLFPTPVERYSQEEVALNEENYEETSEENTGVSIHTVPSTAVRSIRDMDALMFISSSHTPVSISNSFGTNQ
mmetsp:Transcript_17797/g.15707  ORF Transcript_17797/g.15707 Transcript_17797/m.15707 type:complete len:102 (-) Transcript_17797:92-397(-)